MIFNLEKYLIENVQKPENGDFIIFFDDKENPTTEEIYKRNADNFYANNSRRTKLFFQDFEDDLDYEITKGIYPAFLFFDSEKVQLAYIEMLNKEELDEMDS
jgi:hypothetical protein